jgi:hypothetical protein
MGPRKEMELARTNVEWVAQGLTFETWVIRPGPICEEKPRSPKEQVCSAWEIEE